MKRGEFGFIRKLMKKLPKTTSGVIMGAGDDTGVIKMSEDSYLLATTDSQVEGVHFLSQFAAAADIGRKSVAVNVSDIAAMGGMPTYCLVSLILPKSLFEKCHSERSRGISHACVNSHSREIYHKGTTHFVGSPPRATLGRDDNSIFVDQLYDGIIEECKKYDIQIIGGNISKGKQLVVDIFMLGKTTPSRLLLRKGAKPGDKILVTGSLGGAAAGLQLLLNPKISVPLPPLVKGVPKAGDLSTDLFSKQFTPTPRLDESRIISGKHSATSMIDISDGLGADLGHICESSKVGARIFEKKIPITDVVRDVAEKLKKNPWELALNGGEDYELCFTAPESEAAGIASAVKQKTGTDVTVIGEILPENEGKWLVLKNGKTIPLPVEGWDHFI